VRLRPNHFRFFGLVVSPAAVFSSAFVSIAAAFSSFSGGGAAEAVSLAETFSALSAFSAFSGFEGFSFPFFFRQTSNRKSNRRSDQ